MRSDRSKRLLLTRAARRKAQASDSALEKLLAAKSEELDDIQTSLGEAASISGALWLSYLFTLFYFSVAAGAVTHVDLLLEQPVKLPFLNIDLPLLAFFVLAPILFVVAHVYTLAHFALLGRKAAFYHLALYRAFPSPQEEPTLEKEKVAANAEKRNSRRRLLPNNIFVQFLAGPPEVRKSNFGHLLKLIAWITLVLGPIALLLLLQFQFLPYHSAPVTWIARIAVAVDLLFVWWLSREILFGRNDLRDAGRWTTWGTTAIAAMLSGFLVLLSWSIGTFPGEWLNNQQLLTWKFMPTEWTVPASTLVPALRREIERLSSGTKVGSEEEFRSADEIALWCDKKKLRTDTDRPDGILAWAASTCPVSLHDGFFAGAIDDATRRRTSPFSNTLVLPGFNLFEAKKKQSPDEVAWKDHIVNLRGRDLKGAVFAGANLGKADLKHALLQGASLDDASLQGADLGDAQLQGASLKSAQLQGASFMGAQLQDALLEVAQLQGAFLKEAQLQGASLEGARLQGANLLYAQLQGASLKGTQLQGAMLNYAQGQGASLNYAQGQGASLKYAQLQGAGLDNAELQGASLDGAQLQGASLDGAQLQGATLVWANLEAASLVGVHLQGASLDGAQLQGANLTRAELKGASLKGSQLQGASLNEAQLQGADFNEATLIAVDLSSAQLWRAHGKPAEATLLFVSPGSLHYSMWRPTARNEGVPWSTSSYGDLLKEFLAVPEGQLRKEALERIKILACTNPNPCDASIEWADDGLRAEVENNKAAPNPAAVGNIFGDLVCNGSPDARVVLQGFFRDVRFPVELVKAFVNRIFSSACPLLEIITKNEKQYLLQIKQTYNQ